MLAPVWQERIARLKANAANAREKARELATVAKETFETAGTAGLIGYFETKREAEGRGHVEVFGMDLEMAIGLGAHAAVLTGVARGMEDDLRAIGNGGLAVVAFKKGRDLGSRAPGGGALPGT